MRKIILHLPKYRLDMQFKLSKRRKSRFDEPLLASRSILKKKYRIGGYAHRFIRHIFEHKAIKKLLGTNIALMLVATSFSPSGASLSANSLGLAADQNVVISSEADIPLTTVKSIQNPVGKMSITQGYKFYHPGLDIDGITGDPIKPIKNGIVVKVSYSKFAYGNSVVVDHQDGLSSLYAHLSKINVTEGQKVDTQTIIGKMGATGRSFGDHLHLEVYDKGVAINPLLILPK